MDFIPNALLKRNGGRTPTQVEVDDFLWEEEVMRRAAEADLRREHERNVLKANFDRRAHGHSHSSGGAPWKI